MTPRTVPLEAIGSLVYRRSTICKCPILSDTVRQSVFQGKCCPIKTWAVQPATPASTPLLPLRLCPRGHLGFHAHVSPSPAQSCRRASWRHRTVTLVAFTASSVLRGRQQSSQVTHYFIPKRNRLFLPFFLHLCGDEDTGMPAALALLPSLGLRPQPSVPSVQRS